MKKVRLLDIAALAQVSSATVTRVIRNNGYVSAEKRKKIEDAIFKLGYVATPSTIARPMPEAKIIGHIVPNSYRNPLFARFSDGINSIALAHGYHVITVNADEKTDAVQISHMIDTLRQYNASGIILSSLGNASELMKIHKFLSNLPLPLVMVERTADIYGINKVLVNAKESVFAAVEHLASFGHHHIVYIAPKRDNDVELKRLSGFNLAVEAFHCLPNAQSIISDDYEVVDGYEAISRYCASQRIPSAIIAADSLITGVLQYFGERNIRVPQDVSLVGLDDTLARFCAPPLTSVAFPIAEIAETTMNIILDANRKNSVFYPKVVMLSPKLIERKSVAAPCSR